MKKLSIIIPVYNVELYLRQCLDSILASTFRDYELVLVDDGSTDRSGEICDEYAEKDNRIKVFHVANGGVSRARNIGIDSSSAPWITFVDADDMVAPTFFEHLYVEVMKHPEVEFVQAGCTNYRNGQIAEIEQTYPYSHGIDMEYLFPIFRGLTFSKLFKREILDELRFDPKICGAEDLIFTADYLRHIKNYSLLEETGYYYRRDNMTSLMHTARHTTYEEELNAFLHFYDAVFGYISEHKVRSQFTRLRKRQLADKLLFVTTQLFASYPKAEDRIARLRHNLDKKHLRLFKYVSGKKNKIVFTLLRMGLFRAFDYSYIKLYK